MATVPDICVIAAEAFDEPPLVPEQFCVTDADSANWLIRRIVESRAYCERIDAWAAQEKKRAQSDERFLLWKFGGQLRAWAIAEIAKSRGKRRSVNLPGGVVGFRHEPTRLVVDDKNAILPWAHEHCPAAVKTIEKISRSVLNELFEKTGEMPSFGMHVEPEHDKFYVK